MMKNTTVSAKLALVDTRLKREQKHCLLKKRSLISKIFGKGRIKNIMYLYITV